MLIVHSPNIHQGGGQTLLLALVDAINPPARIHIDQRLSSLPLPSVGLEVVSFAPTLAGRLSAELAVRRISTTDDTVLCFGNLPPLFGAAGRVLVFLQNSYLVSREALTDLPFRLRLRIAAERIWLRSRIKNATILVQTPTMARAVRDALGREAIISPFRAASSFPEKVVAPSRSLARVDFLYVGSGEPHKNHAKLLAAWRILAAQGPAPSLGLTIKRDALPELQSVITELEQSGTRIEWFAQRSVGEMDELYAAADALIYPSLMESFGLPLMEARFRGLAIVAAERDYVRDVVVPDETFDPMSPISIARAVQRLQGREPEPIRVMSPMEFLASSVEAH